MKFYFNLALALVLFINAGCDGSNSPGNDNPDNSEYRGKPCPTDNSMNDAFNAAEAELRHLSPDAYQEECPKIYKKHMGKFDGCTSVANKGFDLARTIAGVCRSPNNPNNQLPNNPNNWRSPNNQNNRPSQNNTPGLYQNKACPMEEMNQVAASLQSEAQAVMQKPNPKAACEKLVQNKLGKFDGCINEGETFSVSETINIACRSTPNMPGDTPNMPNNFPME